MGRLKMIDLGYLKFVLKMPLLRNREQGEVTINQEKLRRNILSGFGIRSCKLLNTAGTGSELTLDQTSSSF